MWVLTPRGTNIIGFRSTKPGQSSANPAWIWISLQRIPSQALPTTQLKQYLLRRQIIKERRFVEPFDKEYQYEAGTIPKAWEAWIRKKRKDPPTLEEVFKNENYEEEIKKKIEDIYEKDRLLQAKEYEEGLVAEPLQTQIKGHASSPHYGKNEPSDDPVSTANTFQPGSWMPPQDSARNK
ncbi:NADH dehydrogenase [ubiquinone] 1 alpha subcomplex assembly factor 2 isoform X1 [Rhineura floridana]|uniref:NADH dehydrogenase [ubiquinone] 1 alpha subcomplex assembly factor 2 isoform X1 n=1 Tax=Rhineura floridana TaxID=261503 RepID=UPI002AC7F218|nr:NADH dehydrogenase [ubiquinone] 1 alpha subcomplex assembly factor 2 isoform X1 [Rhineura floridana]